MVILLPILHVTDFHVHSQEEVTTMTNGVPDAAVMRENYERESAFKPSLPGSSPLCLPLQNGKCCFGRGSSKREHLHYSIIHGSKKRENTQWLITEECFSKLWEINPIDYFVIL